MNFLLSLEISYEISPHLLHIFKLNLATQTLGEITRVGILINTAGKTVVVSSVLLTCHSVCCVRTNEFPLTVSILMKKGVSSRRN